MTGKILASSILLVLPSLAQISNRPPDGTPSLAYETLLYRDGSNNTEYICTAYHFQNRATIFHRTTASSTAPLGGTPANLTSIAVAANVATVTTSADHGLRVGQYLNVAGATVDTDLNNTTVPGYKILTVGSTTTLTFTSVSVADATYTEATLNIYTTWTRSSQLVWAIQRKFYTTTFLDRTAWLRGGTVMNLACDSRAGY
jgi:hypothetical protein